jgi:catechol O-methyltransferase
MLLTVPSFSIKRCVFFQASQNKRFRYAIEAGAYCGYSAIRVARLLPKGARLFSCEKSRRSIDIATRMVDFAGLPYCSIL